MTTSWHAFPWTYRPDTDNALTDKPIEGSQMLCQLAVTIPMLADDMALTIDGKQLDMTLTFTPDQMKSVGEFIYR